MPVPSSALFAQQPLVPNTTSSETDTIQPRLVEDHEDVPNAHGIHERYSDQV